MGWPHADVGDLHAFRTLVGADVAQGLKTRRFARLDLATAMQLIAGMVIAGVHQLADGAADDDERVPQVVAAVLRAMGVAPDEAGRLARLEVQLPPLAPGSMLALLAGAAPG